MTFPLQVLVCMTLVSIAISLLHISYGHLAVCVVP